MSKTLSNLAHREEVAARLAITFDALNLKPAQVAKFLEITTSKLGNWLAARNYPDEFLVVRLCDRYGVTADWIYRGNLYGLPSELADDLAVAWAEKKAALAAKARQAP
jgi:transcriptional regulator with XRE-family HTH domain